MREWKESLIGKENERGFTLIEILVVIGIMAVLAAVLIPRLVDTSDESKVQADLANKKLLQSAVERYYFDNNEYPTSGTGDKVGTGAIEMTKLTGGKYIVEEPTDPWGKNRKYSLEAGVVKALEAQATTPAVTPGG